MPAGAGAGTPALAACAPIGCRPWLGSSDSAAGWALAADLGTGVSDGCRWLRSKPSIPGGAAGSTASAASTEALTLRAQTSQIYIEMRVVRTALRDRNSTRLNSSHLG